MQKVFAGQMQNADHGLALAPVRRPAIADGQDMSEELLANRPARRQRRVPRKGLAQRLECRKGASGITSRLGAVPNDLLNEPVDADRIPRHLREREAVQGAKCIGQGLTLAGTFSLDEDRE